MSAEKEESKIETDLSKEQIPKGGSVKFGSVLLIAVIILSLGWYLLADRYTPYTSQARIEGYVVGVAPKVAGLVTDIWVKNNQEVEKGTPLFQIDQSQYQIALEKSLSDLESAQRQVYAGDASVLSAEANLRAAIANQTKASKDYWRQVGLRKEDPGTISIRRLEVSKATLDQAQAKVAAARADIQKAIEQKGGNNDDNNAIIKAAKSSVAKAELDLVNTTVRASLQGVITNLRSDVGQYAGTGSPVLTLISLHDVWINAEFTENNLGHLEVGTPVEILFDVIPGEIFKGNVRTIGLGVDSGNEAAAGTLPTINNDRDWLRQAQRFPVIVEFSTNQGSNLVKQIRIGGQTTVIAYCEDGSFLNGFGKLYIRFMSFLSYAY